MGTFEENEISSKSFGGTEQCKRLIDSKLDLPFKDEFQVICSRVREIDDNKIRIYWLHDLPEDPETNHLKDAASRDRFHKLVFCGNWQYNRYLTMLNIPQDDKCITIDTPVVPLDYSPKPKDVVRLVYTSTPQRGLAILVPVFEELCKKYDNIELDVFSSFSIYGWQDADKGFQELFDRCKNHPKINYHGSQPNEVVRETLQRSHIFSYPSIWHECNSRSLIEAMSAGLLCVHPNLAGLADTSGGLTGMYQYVQDHNGHANKFYHVLDRAIQVVNEENTQNYLKFVKGYADSRYNADTITTHWRDLMTGLHEQYKDPSSRTVPKAVFRYTTS